MAKNDFLKKRDERDRKFYDAGMVMGVQLCHDYVQMALRDPDVMKKDIFGRERIEKLFKKCTEYDEHFSIAFSREVDADYVQEEMDSILREIWGKDLVPFAERYPYAKQFSYKKAQKGWVD